MSLFFMSEATIEQLNTPGQDQFEAKQNLTGFFKLLLEIDMRVNPELYGNYRDPNHTN
ncbi:MAG: hypothetical protein PHU86_01415 [Patescibacteria group bacterium]|nr:hypothetical protein [Patescibacteria group bacterium]